MKLLGGGFAAVAITLAGLGVAAPALAQSMQLRDLGVGSRATGVDDGGSAVGVFRGASTGELWQVRWWGRDGVARSLPSTSAEVRYITDESGPTIAGNGSRIGISVDPISPLAWSLGTAGASPDWTLYAGTGPTRVHGLSANGQVAVGTQGAVNTSQERAVRWTTSGISILSGISTKSRALGTSTDGGVVGGWLMEGTSKRAFRWNGTAVTALDQLGSTQSEALAVSRDGSRLAGWSWNGNADERAVLWTSTGAVQSLGTIDAHLGWMHNSRALCMNATSGLVGGYSQLVGTQAKTAFIWQSSTNTMVSLMAYLQSLGVSAGTLSGWNFHEVTGISADGKNIVGNGTLGSDTSVRGFVFAVPAPSVAALAAVAGSLLRRRRR